MIKSMTGYGRGENEHEGRKFAVEMRAVNHRYGDISIKIPRFMIYLEDRIKKTVAASVHRGKTDVFISYENTSDAGVEIVLNEALALAYISKLDELEALGASGSNKLALAARFPDVITANRPEEDEELLWEILLPALKSAIESFIAMRELEGAALKKDILLKRETMMELLEKIEQRAPLVPLEYKEKLKARVSELLQEVTIDEQRLMAEFTVFADKCCVDEEITRL
ncbi:MAG: hypothetical protein IJC39_04955, partial [Firmicutes bacterium]|nr:hypothetical protein [Bacillota bacterium]